MIRAGGNELTESNDSNSTLQLLITSLERSVSAGQITSIANVMRVQLLESNQLQSTQSLIRQMRDSGYVHLAYRIVSSNGFLFLKESKEAQRRFLVEEGIRFISEWHVDLENHRPVELV